MRLENLTAFQLDALTEAGNIGSGHAATALSQLLGNPIEISVPTLDMVPLGEVPSILGGPEILVTAVFSRLLGEIEGGMLFMCDRDSALTLVDMLRNRPLGSTKSMRIEEEQLFKHAASVLISAYLSAIARLADLNALPSRPYFAMDMAGAILESVAAEAAMKADSALVLRADFLNEESRCSSFIFFLPDQDSLDVLLGRLGVS